MTEDYRVGQRWISASEPELGLGEIKAVSGRTLTVVFRAANESRQYVAANAPLRRASFRVGDTIRTANRHDIVVDAVEERGGLLFYRSGADEVSERELSDTLSFSSPTTRLFAGQFDASTVFELRRAALQHQHRRRHSPVRGFLGGRIDLLPHQLGIAAEVTGRLTPRVLLADEVGLGKTIEACLILHRQILTGRASRVLIVVPESLVHQWFVELLRRFNLWFHIFNEGRCAAIEESDPGVNPFLEQQLIVCDLPFLTYEEGRLAQAVAAGWDLVVVDEAHHLRWTPEASSPEYLAIEALGRQAPGLLLLTATPEQLGMTGHFARLRLLDPDRFHDFEAFAQEAENYRATAALAGGLVEAGTLTPAAALALAGSLGESIDDVRRIVADESTAAAAVRRQWLDRLLDRHGTGRVMFRNTRATIAGFPRRVAHLHPLSLGEGHRTSVKSLAQEFEADIASGTDPSGRLNLTGDPRVEWLAALLGSLPDDKVLVICRTVEKTLAIEAALKERTTIPLGVFHERLSLVQRDRAAASFGDRHGLRLLVSSEIGSEGRNFQFAHHLVLFDLPLDPSVIEQRIGRLDRIGQTEDIHVHVPFVAGSPQELVARWYHEGANLFAENFHGGRELLDRFAPRLLDLARRRGKSSSDGPEFQALLADVAAARTDIARRLESGRDRLLEWNSFRPAMAQALVETIRAHDEDRALAEFMLLVFDHYFIEVEEIGPRTYRLGSAGVLRDTFPGLSSEGLTITAERRRALTREDLQFLTWDHPLVNGALDMLLGSDHGNCAFARWPDPKISGLYLDTIYMLECIAPAALHVDRFLPPTPIAVAVDHRGHDATLEIAAAPLARDAAAGSSRALMTRADIRDTLLPRLLERTAQLASAQVPAVVERARAEAHARLGDELERLRALQKVNRSVRDDEISRLAEEQRRLDEQIGSARLRLDAVRLIYRGPQR